MKTVRTFLLTAIFLVSLFADQTLEILSNNIRWNSIKIPETINEENPLIFIGVLDESLEEKWSGVRPIGLLNMSNVNKVNIELTIKDSPDKSYVEAKLTDPHSGKENSWTDNFLVENPAIILNIETLEYPHLVYNMVRFIKICNSKDRSISKHSYVIGYGDINYLKNNIVISKLAPNWKWKPSLF